MKFSNASQQRKSLSTEIATRSRSIDFSYLSGYLPDPDPILKATGQSITVYRELTSDAHVFSCIQSRKAGTLCKEWSIEPASNSRKDKYAADLVSSQFDGLKKQMQRIIGEILDAVLYGISPLEVLWQTDGNTIVAGDIVGKPPEWFCFDDQNRLRFLTRADMLRGEEIGPKKVLLARHLDSYQNPYGERVLSRCFWPVTFKKGGFKFWVVFTEKYGMPFMIGKVPPGTGTTERDALADLLEDMIQDAVAVINDNESVEMKESGSKSASADIYERLIQAANAESSKAVVGQTLTTEVTGSQGSYAASQTHQEVRTDLIELDDKLVIGTMTEFIEWMVDFNLDGAGYPTFSFIEEEDVQKDRSERDKNLIICGWRPTEQYFEKAYNLEAGDFTVVEPTPTGQGMGFDGMPGDGGMPGEISPAGNVIPNKESDLQINSFAAQGFSPDQQAIENMVDQASGKSQKFFDGMSDEIVAMVKSCSSYDELDRMILAAYPKLDITKHRELLQEAIFASEMWGRYQMQQQQQRQQKARQKARLIATRKEAR